MPWQKVLFCTITFPLIFCYFMKKNTKPLWRLWKLYWEGFLDNISLPVHLCHCLYRQCVSPQVVERKFPDSTFNSSNLATNNCVINFHILALVTYDKLTITYFFYMLEENPLHKDLILFNWRCLIFRIGIN